MSTKPRILCVDDEPDLLDGLRLNLRKRFKVTTATSGAEGLEVFDAACTEDEGPFEAVVSDMRMPNMNGAAFLTAVMERSPQTPRILLSGQADMESTIAAINDAKIFRFLTKPCEPELIQETLHEAMELARLREAERVLLDQTVRGAVTMLTEVLGLVSAAAYSRTSRVREVVDQIRANLRLEASWDLDVATLLSQVGCVVVPETDDADGPAGQHAEIAANLLANIPRLETAASIVRTQNAPDPLLAGPMSEASRALIDAEILRVAVAFDAVTASGTSAAKAVGVLRNAANPPDPELLEALSEVRPAADDMIEVSVEPEDLVIGMELLEDLHTRSGAKLAGAGTVLTAVLIERVTSFAKTAGVDGPVAAMAPRRAISRLKVR